MMSHKWKVVRRLLCLTINILLIGPLGIPESSGAAAGFTHTDTGGGVTVNVTYIHPQNENEIRFQVVLDTHTVDLDGYNLKALSTLRDDTGKSYQPVKVDNRGGGHHREITLVFPKVSLSAKRLELIIKDIGRVKERFFFWDLQ